MGDSTWDSRAPNRSRPPQPAAPPPSVGGPAGFIELATSLAARPKLSRDQISTFLPQGRGRFQFPPPYNTEGIRLTIPDDGEILPTGYGYWARVNNHQGSATLWVFLGRPTGDVLFLEVHKASGAVQPSTALFPYRGTAEQWYWSARLSTSLYLTDGPRLVRHDLATGEDEVVVQLSGDQYVWQPHSSFDDQTHSLTVREVGTERMLGSLVERRGTRYFFPPTGQLDECQIDQSGRYLTIKEDDDNRIIDLETQKERRLLNREGAAGHSDCGYESLVGEDDYFALPGALRSWDLANLDLPPRLHYHLTQWETGMGEVCVRGDRALLSHAHRVDHPRVNELVRVRLDGSLQAEILAPNLIDLNATGGNGTATDPRTQEYNKSPKANLDPLGQYACWTANCGSDRLDAFLLKLP